MSIPIPLPVWIHRIVHERNLSAILQQGIVTRGSVQHNDNYTFIGDSKLTDDRHVYPIPLPNCGCLGDYVPFYFGPLSPMLLNIKTGYRGIPQRPQEEIIYLSCKVDSIVNNGLSFVFTDGHAVDKLTGFYQSLNDLDKVDWSVVKERYWYNTEEDWDRQRRKQAEFLVHKQVKPELIDAIVVLNQEKLTFVKGIVYQAGLSTPVYVNPGGKFYYP